MLLLWEWDSEKKISQEEGEIWVKKSFKKRKRKVRIISQANKNIIGIPCKARPIP